MTTSLRTDVLRIIELRSQERQSTVLGRRGRENHYTGSQLLTKAKTASSDGIIVFGERPHVLIAALPVGEAFLFGLLAFLIGEGMPSAPQP
ncbi:hypothetical protein A9Q94_01005 [Rhodobacterales bacterium 56_14_T64]|nr:hypothetical protein A9Q94_01005 [Rhodobacterales bacterium 56_14_T64]